MTFAKAIPSFHAVIPAGGAGSRLWPVSRAHAPKFLIDPLSTGRTLIQQTWDRLVGLAAPERMFVVTGRVHAAAVAAQLPGLEAANLLQEASPKDSMAAIGLAAAVLAERRGDVVLGAFPADHAITVERKFEDAVTQAVLAALDGYITTIGITPREPSTAYGYIKVGGSVGILDAPEVCHAESFTEKPDAATAKRYLTCGMYRWNAGMFVFRVNVLLAHLENQHPQLHSGLRRIARAWDTPERDQVMNEVWPQLLAISIDHALAEPVAAQGGVAVAPGEFAWNDLGDWATIASLTPASGGGVRVLKATATERPVLAVNAKDVFAYQGTDRAIAVVGVDDVEVIDTPDAVVVAATGQAQRVKDVVEQLRDGGWADLT
jgi:mannose-1-phosphate guanylyltransferase